MRVGMQYHHCRVAAWLHLRYYAATGQQWYSQNSTLAVVPGAVSDDQSQSITEIRSDITAAQR